MKRGMVLILCTGWALLALGVGVADAAPTISTPAGEDPALAQPGSGMGVEVVPKRLPRTYQNPDGSPVGRCWSAETEISDGWFPYRHRLFLKTVWCGHAGVITYRESMPRTQHDFTCHDTNGPYALRMFGGAGAGFVDVRAWVNVFCYSLPSYWPGYNEHLMQEIRYYPWGGYVAIAYAR